MKPNKPLGSLTNVKLFTCERTNSGKSSKASAKRLLYFFSSSVKVIPSATLNKVAEVDAVSSLSITKLSLSSLVTSLAFSDTNGLSALVDSDSVERLERTLGFNASSDGTSEGLDSEVVGTSFVVTSVTSLEVADKSLVTDSTTEVLDTLCSVSFESETTSVGLETSKLETKFSTFVG